MAVIHKNGVCNEHFYGNKQWNYDLQIILMPRNLDIAMLRSTEMWFMQRSLCIVATRWLKKRSH